MSHHEPAASADAAPHPVDVHVGARLRLARKAKGMSQTGLAVPLGLTFQQVQKYERGVNRVSMSKAWDMARILEIDINYLYDGLPPGKVDQDFQDRLKGISEVHDAPDLIAVYGQLSTRQQRAVMGIAQLLAAGGREEFDDAELEAAA